MSLATEAAALEAVAQELKETTDILKARVLVLETREQHLLPRVDALESQPAVDADVLATILRQQDLLYQALKQLLQGRWNGEIPHAEMFAKAIRDDEAGTWSAVEFPRPNP